MKKANLERSSTAKVTGHRNIPSLDYYDEVDEYNSDSFRTISETLAHAIGQ